MLELLILSLLLHCPSGHCPARPAPPVVAVPVRVPGWGRTLPPASHLHWQARARFYAPRLPRRVR